MGQFLRHLNLCLQGLLEPTLSYPTFLWDTFDDGVLLSTRNFVNGESDNHHSRWAAELV